MKTRCLVGFLGALALSANAATQNAILHLKLDDFQLESVVTSARLTPLTIPNVNSNSIIYPTAKTRQTTSGECYWSNTLSGTYLLQFLPMQSTFGYSYVIGVPQTNIIVEVRDLLTNTVSLVTNTIRIYTGDLIITNNALGGSATNAPWPVAGTNVLASTNGYEVTINGLTDTNVVNALARVHTNNLATQAFAQAQTNDFATKSFAQALTNDYATKSFAQSLTNDYATKTYANALTNDFATKTFSQSLTNPFATIDFVTNSTVKTNQVTGVPTTGYIPKISAGGVITWAADATAGSLTEADLTNTLVSPIWHNISGVAYKSQLGDANLTNWARLATNTFDLKYQTGGSNLTNWDRLATNTFDLKYQTGGANLTNWGELSTNDFATKVYAQALTNTFSTTNWVYSIYQWMAGNVGSGLTYYGDTFEGNYLYAKLGGGLTNMGWISGHGVGLTNIAATNLTGGGVLPAGTVAGITNTGNGWFLGNSNSVRAWSRNGGAFTNLNATELRSGTIASDRFITGGAAGKLPRLTGDANVWEWVDPGASTTQLTAATNTGNYITANGNPKSADLSAATNATWLTEKYTAAQSQSSTNVVAGWVASATNTGNYITASALGTGATLTAAQVSNAIPAIITNATVNIADGANGVNQTNSGTLTANGFLSPTNICYLELTAGRAYITNINGNAVLTAFAGVPHDKVWSIFLLVTNSTANDYTLTFPGGTYGSGNGTPPVFYCTNKIRTEFQVNGWGVYSTNVNWSPHW